MHSSVRLNFRPYHFIWLTFSSYSYSFATSSVTYSEICQNFSNTGTSHYFSGQVTLEGLVDNAESKTTKPATSSKISTPLCAGKCASQKNLSIFVNENLLFVVVCCMFFNNPIYFSDPSLFILIRQNKFWIKQVSELVCHNNLHKKYETWSKEICIQYGQFYWQIIKTFHEWSAREEIH